MKCRFFKPPRCFYFFRFARIISNNQQTECSQQRLVSMRKQELHPYTAVINRKQRVQSKSARIEALNWLSLRFPEAFDNTTMIRPLKLGIMEDILNHAEEAKTAGISKSKLREAVVIYTRRIDYLICLKAKEMRIDLQGQAVSMVNEEDAERAALKIRKRIEKTTKSARKILASKAPIQNNKTKDQTEVTVAAEPLFQYPHRANLHPLPVESNRRAQVVIKQKPIPRSFDPEAVARLKEKLGLSRKIPAEK